MEKRVRLGIIGYGGIAENYHIPAIAKVAEAEMVAVADLDESRARECARTYGVPDVYTDYRRIMERKDIDAVVLLTRCDVHVEVVSAAAAVGKHVFMQKPFAIDVNDGKKIVEIARGGGIRVVTSFMHRYLDESVKAGELLREGAIGKIEMIRHRNAIFGSYKNAVRLWGGVMDIGPHGIDLVRFFSGQQFLKVAAMMNSYLTGLTPNTDGPAGRAVDTVAIMNYELSGRVLASHEVHWTQRGGQGRFTTEIFGDEGTLYVRPFFTDKPVALVKDGKATFPKTEQTYMGVRHHKAFVDDILNDTHNSASVEEGFEALCVTEASYRSAMQGGDPVSV